MSLKIEAIPFTATFDSQGAAQVSPATAVAASVINRDLGTYKSLQSMEYLNPHDIVFDDNGNFETSQEAEIRRGSPVYDLDGTQGIFISSEQNVEENQACVAKIQEALDSIGSKIACPIMQMWLTTELLAKQLAYKLPIQSESASLDDTLQAGVLLRLPTEKGMQNYRWISIDIYHGHPMFLLIPEDDTLPPHVIFRGTANLTSAHSDISVNAIRRGIGADVFEQAKPILDPLFSILNKRFPQKMIVSGHSMGGCNAQEAAATYPQYFQRAFAFSSPMVSSRVAKLWNGIEGEKPILWVTNRKGDPISQYGSYAIGSQITVSAPTTETRPFKRVKELHGAPVLQKKNIQFRILKEGNWLIRTGNGVFRAVTFVIGIITLPVKLFFAVIGNILYFAWFGFRKFFFYLTDQDPSYDGGLIREKFYGRNDIIGDLKSARDIPDPIIAWHTALNALIVREGSSASSSETSSKRSSIFSSNDSLTPSITPSEEDAESLSEDQIDRTALDHMRLGALYYGSTSFDPHFQT